MVVRASICLVFVLVASCASADKACRVGADCASGVCLADGTCEITAGDDAGATSDGAPARDGSTRDGGGSCSPNRDNMVARDEVTLGPGLRAPFRIARDATLSTAGTTRGDGTRSWNLGGALTGDHDVQVETLPIAGQWFASSFAGATYASKLSDAQDLLGVFEVTSAALLLRGVVSPQAGNLRTELVYDPPVVVLAFPLRMGGSFRTTSTITGLASGVFSTYQEAYESDVDARGDLTTPYGDFPVLRVRVVLRRTIGLLTTTVRSYLFVAECFGTVAAVTSQDNEASIEFTRATEARRLAP